VEKQLLTHFILTLQQVTAMFCGIGYEMPVHFDMTSNYTVNDTTAKCIVMKTLSNERMQVIPLTAQNHCQM
jgi:hypothetical protein